MYASNCFYQAVFEYASSKSILENKLYVADSNPEGGILQLDFF